MSFPSFIIDQHIIKEYKDKRAKITSQNFIHETLESGGSIAESKRHNPYLIMVFVGVERNLRNVNLFHAYLAVAWSKIQFREEDGTMEFIEEIINDWDGKLIFDSQFIDDTEIKTHMPITFLL